VRNALVLATLILSFATFVTAHLVIATRLFLTPRQRYRGLLVFVVPPLAPMWAYRQNWKSLCWIWVAAIVCYAVAVAIAGL
jgi:hypothetical protein